MMGRGFAVVALVAALACGLAAGRAEAKTRLCRGVDVGGFAKTRIRAIAPRGQQLSCARAHHVMVLLLHGPLRPLQETGWSCEARDQAHTVLYTCRHRGGLRVVLVAASPNVFAQYELSNDHIDGFDYERFFQDLQQRRCRYATPEHPYPGMLRADASLWAETGYRFSQTTGFGFSYWFDRPPCSTERAVYSTGPERLRFRVLLLDYARHAAAASRYYFGDSEPVLYSEFAGWFNRMRDYVLCRAPGTKVLTLRQLLKLHHVKPRTGAPTPPQESAAFDCPTGPG